MSYIQTINEIYQAFGRGDVPAILEKLSDNIEWEYSGVETDVPWLKPRAGQSGAAEFFEAVGKELEFSLFDVNDLLEGDRVVVALLNVGFKVRSTGKQIVEKDEIHVFRFDEDGKISGFRHGVDTYAHYLAFRSVTSGSAA